MEQAPLIEDSLPLDQIYQKKIQELNSEIKYIQEDTEKNKQELQDKKKSFVQLTSFTERHEIAKSQEASAKQSLNQHLSAKNFQVNQATNQLDYIMKSLLSKQDKLKSLKVKFCDAKRKSNELEAASIRLEQEISSMQEKQLLEVKENERLNQEIKLARAEELTLNQEINKVCESIAKKIEEINKVNSSGTLTKKTELVYVPSSKNRRSNVASPNKKIDKSSAEEVTTADESVGEDLQKNRKEIELKALRAKKDSLIFEQRRLMNEVSMIKNANLGLQAWNSSYEEASQSQILKYFFFSLFICLAIIFLARYY